MRRFLFTLIGFLLLIPLSAQDLIVTDKGDSLNCKIKSVNDNFIYFRYRHKNHYRHAFLPVNDVSSYKENYYPASDVPTLWDKNRKDYASWRIALNGGYSTLIASKVHFISDDRSLRNGAHLGAHATHFLSEYLGLGLVYNSFYSSSKNELAALSEHTAIQYTGLSCTTRLLNNERNNALFLGLSMGYVHFYDKACMPEPFHSSGNTLGATVDLGYDFSISRVWSLGVNCSWFNAALYHYNKTINNTTERISLNNKNYINLSRFDFSIGLRYNVNN